MKVDKAHSGRLPIYYAKTLFRYAKYRVWLSLGLMVFSGLTQGVGLVMLIPFLGLIGMGGADGPGGLTAHAGRIFGWFNLDLNLVTVLCLYVCIIAIYAAATRYQTVLNTRIVYGFTQALRDRLYRSLCRAEWLCLLRTRSSDVTQALTSDTQRVGFATQQLLHLGSTLIIASVHIWVSLIISPPMTLFALACVGGFLLLLRPLNRTAHGTGEALRGNMTKLYGEVTEHLGGMKLARSYSLDEVHEENFSGITRGVTDQMVRFIRINSATRMIYEIGAAVVLAIFFFIAVEIYRMPAHSLLIIVFLFARLLPRFSSMQQSAQRIVNTLPSFQAVLDMKERFEAAGEPPPSGVAKRVGLEGEIGISHVFFRYDRNFEKWALRDVSLVVPARGMTALVGPSGAGKSTLADLILGLLSPERGSITIDGRPLKDGFVHAWRRSVGYVPQDIFLFHDTIRANLLWAMPDATEEDLWAALELASARDFVSRLPQAIDTVVGDRGMRVSGGERQRIALARALLRKPTLLLLDEATSSVDSESERRIQQAVNKIRGGLTIVVIAHRSSTILMADTVATLDKGTIVDGSAVFS